MGWPNSADAATPFSGAGCGSGRTAPSLERKIWAAFDKVARRHGASADLVPHDAHGSPLPRADIFDLRRSISVV
jgi:hypothetical protein